MNINKSMLQRCLQDRTYLRQNHKIAEGETHTCLRLLYYLPNTDFKEQGTTCIYTHKVTKIL